MESQCRYSSGSGTTAFSKDSPLNTNRTSNRLSLKYQPDTYFQVPDDGPDSNDGSGAGSLVLISLGVIVLVALLIASMFKIRPDEHFKKWWENRSHTGIDYSAEDSL